MPNELPPPARPLSFGPYARIRQPDRRQQVAPGELGQQPAVDPIGLAGQQRQSFQLLRVGDLDLPTMKLEPLVHEASAVHRLVRGTDRLAVSSDALASLPQAISVRRRSAAPFFMALLTMEAEEFGVGSEEAGFPP